MDSAKILTLAFSVYLLCSVSFASREQNFLQGYYWREFFGLLPDDAFEGGVGLSGNPIYIGQILHESKLIPTKIYTNDPKGYYGLAGRAYSGTKNQKILCTKSSNNFKWVRTKKDQIHLLTNHEIVLGGFEPRCTLYIGRTVYRSETSVGKVSVCETIGYGLFITNGGTEINLDEFDILTYNSSIPQITVLDV